MWYSYPCMSFSPHPNLYASPNRNHDHYHTQDHHLPTTTVAGFSLRGSWALSRFACSRCHQFWCSLGCSCFGKTMEPGAYLLSDVQTWERCSPKTWTNHILHLFILENCWQHDLIWFFVWAILTFEWNKASSTYPTRRFSLLILFIVCCSCLKTSSLTIRLLQKISQVLYLLEEMDQNLDRQMRKPATQLPSCQWNIPPFSLLLPDANDLWEFGLQTSPITNDLLFVICSKVQIGFVCEKDLGSNRQTRMKRQTTTTSQRFAMSLFGHWAIRKHFERTDFSSFGL